MSHNIIRNSQEVYCLKKRAKNMYSISYTTTTTVTSHHCGHAETAVTVGNFYRHAVPRFGFTMTVLTVVASSPEDRRSRVKNPCCLPSSARAPRQSLQPQCKSSFQDIVKVSFLRHSARNPLNRDMIKESNGTKEAHATTRFSSRHEQ